MARIDVNALANLGISQLELDDGGTTAIFPIAGLAKIAKLLDRPVNRKGKTLDDLANLNIRISVRGDSFVCYAPADLLSRIHKPTLAESYAELAIGTRDMMKGIDPRGRN